MRELHIHSRELESGDEVYLPTIGQYAQALNVRKATDDAGANSYIVFEIEGVHARTVVLCGTHVKVRI